MENDIGVNPLLAGQSSLYYTLQNIKAHRAITLCGPCVWFDFGAVFPHF